MGLEKVIFEKVRQLQKHDVFYSAMYHYLQKGHKPVKEVLARKIRANKNVYTIANKLLYRLWNKRSDKKYVQTTVYSKRIKKPDSQCVTQYQFHMSSGSI